MYDYRKVLKKYIDSAQNADMEVLADLTESFIHKMSETNPEQVEGFLKELVLYIEPFANRKNAVAVVQNMKNDDGSAGPHWDYDTVSKVAEENEIDCVPEFYYVLNMVYSDYYCKNYTDSDYIRMAVQFLDDKDGPRDKAVRYYRAMRY